MFSTTQFLRAAAVASALSFPSLFSVSCQTERPSVPGAASGLGAHDAESATPGASSPPFLDVPDVMAGGAVDALPSKTVDVVPPPVDVYIPPVDTAGSVPATTPLAPPADKFVSGTQSLPGELEQLAAGHKGGVKGVYALSESPGQFGTAPALRLFFVTPTGVTPLAQLPNAFDAKTGQPRFGVNALFQGTNGRLYLLLQSTEGFNPDGETQQIWILEADGSLVRIVDYLAGATAFTRPQSLLELPDGRRVVLLNNCAKAAAVVDGELRVACGEDSALAVYQTADLSDSPKVISLTGARNSQALGIRSGKLVVASAGDVHMGAKTGSGLRSLALDSLDGMGSQTSEDSFVGLGIGGPLLAVDGDQLLVVANSFSYHGGLGRITGTASYDVPVPAAMVYVAGAVFIDSQTVLYAGMESPVGLTPADAPWVTRAYRHAVGKTGLTAVGPSLPSLHTAGLATYDQWSFGYGAAGTAKVKGALQSSVVFVYPEP